MGRNILVVDDDGVTRKLVEAFLVPRGFMVFGAVDGEHAVDILNCFIPDLIITDLQMPRMDGLQLSRHVRTNEKFEGVKIILGTSCDYPPVSTADKPFDLFVQKPYDARELPGLIMDLLAH